MAAKAKFLLLPLIVWIYSTCLLSLRPFLCTGRIEETPPWALDLHHWNHVVTVDIPSVSPGSIIDSYVDESQGFIV